MSEENPNAFMLKRISELEAAARIASDESTKWKARYRREQEALAKLKTANDALAKDQPAALDKLTKERDALILERDALKGKVDSSPSEWKTKAEDLQKELRARDAKDAWAEVLGKDSLCDKVTIEKLWKDIEYTPGEVVPTPEEIKEQLATARESVPYLFKTAGDTPAETRQGSKTSTAAPPLRDTVPGGRGAPDKTASRVTVKKSQMQDFRWMLDDRNQKMVEDAQSRGVLDIVDG